MKISFHNHSKSLISPIINKSQINKTFKEKIEPKQLSNIEGDNILIDNITRNKREKTNITSLKLNSISKPKSLYITTNENYGKQKPNDLELPDKWYPINTKFTRECGTLMYRNSSLNCSESRSKVHASLDSVV